MTGSQTKDLESLYFEYKDMVFRVCLRFSRGNTEWASDRTQEVFLRLAEKWDNLPVIENYKAFIYRTTMNLCINKVRRQKNIIFLVARYFKPGKEIETATGRDFSPPDESAHHINLLKELDGAIEKLPLKMQEVIILYYLEDIDIPTIATILDINKGTVSRRLKSARKKLELILGERWFEEND